MRKFIFMITFTLVSIGLISQSAYATELILSAPNTASQATNVPGRTAITPYIQAVPNDSYTFMAFSHPSLDTSASQIGLVVEVLDMTTVPDSTAGASVNFTVNAGETHRVFVVNNTHSTINATNSSFTYTDKTPGDLVTERSPIVRETDISSAPSRIRSSFLVLPMP